MHIPLSEMDNVLDLIGKAGNAIGGATKVLGPLFRRSQISVPAPANDNTGDSAFLRQVLIAADAPDDPLTGIWELFDWPVPANSESMKGRQVSNGSLTILYQNRTDLSWHGIMTHTIKVSPLEPEGPKSEPPFTAIYDVEFQKEKAEYTGSSKMSGKWYEHSTPELEAQWEEQKKYQHKGIFEVGKVLGKGAAQMFTGKFETTRRSGPVPFKFARRQRWSHVQHLMRAGQ